MPANLPPNYYAAEEKFRTAESTSAKIACLDELISTVPKHKGTDHLRAELRRKLSRLKSERHKKKSVSRHESEYHIEKEGSGRIVVIGPTNAGKSSLVARLTHATPKISESPFTTWAPIPGMMNVKDVHLQLIDTPSMSNKYTKPELFDLIRTSDLLLLMLDIRAFPIQQFDDSIAMLEKHKIAADFLKERFNDLKSMTIIRTMIVINKVDNQILRADFDTFCELEQADWPVIPVSVQNQYNLDLMGKRCMEMMQLMRIYSKPPGKEPEMNQPYVLKIGSTINDFAGKVHRDFINNLKRARVWGKNVFDGQLVGRDHILNDGDVVELHT